MTYVTRRDTAPYGGSTTLEYESRPARATGQWPWEAIEATTVPGERLGWRHKGGGGWEHPATGKLRRVLGDKLIFAVLDASEEALDRLAEIGG